MGDRAFSLNIKNKTGKGKLTYVSSDKKVAVVNKNGKVTIKGVGIAVVTVKAAATKGYSAKSVKITIQVNPSKQNLKALKVVKGRKLTVNWKKDTKASGYQIQYSLDKNFKKKVKTVWVKKNRTISGTVSGLTKGKRYYVRVRSYKTEKLNGKSIKLYGKWSTAKRSATIRK